MHDLPVVHARPLHSQGTRTWERFPTAALDVRAVVVPPLPLSAQPDATQAAAVCEPAPAQPHSRAVPGKRSVGLSDGTIRVLTMPSRSRFFAKNRVKPTMAPLVVVDHRGATLERRHACWVDDARALVHVERCELGDREHLQYVASVDRVDVRGVFPPSSTCSRWLPVCRLSRSG